MKEEISGATSQILTHSPVAGWFTVMGSYIISGWLSWGSSVAGLVTFLLGTLLTLVLLANHSITLYKSITNKSDDKGKQ